MSGVPIDFEVALDAVRRHVQPLERVGEVDYRDSVGEVLAEVVFADQDMPPFDQSRMDGYALAAPLPASLPCTLGIAGSVKAGDAPGATVGQGEAVKVMTGAPVPAGACLVVRVEDTRVIDGGERVHVLALPDREHTNMSARGSDFTAGRELLAVGRRVTIADLAVLATVGATRVRVRAPDRTAVVISGGDELVSPDQRPQPGQIRNSNGATLRRLLESLHMPVRELPDLGVAGDTHAEHLAALEAGLDAADLVVTSGGVSMGDFDVVPDVIRSAGGTIHFDRVALQPGKPVTLATTAAGKVILALPGNPCSAFVTCLLFGRAVVERLLGRDELGPIRERRRLASAVRGPAPRRRFLPGCRADGDRVELVRWTGSGDLWGFARADVLVVLPEGEGPFQAGDEVDVVPMPLR